MRATSLALIGCGGWGRNLARNVHDLGALRWIIDPSPAAEQIAHEMGVGYANNIEAALQDAQVAGILIASPAEHHFKHAMAALSADKHVYVEKPIATSLDDANEMARFAQDRRLLVMVGHLMHYHPAFNELVGLVRANRMGAVKHIASQRLNLGVLRNEENVMWSFAPHDVSMVLGLLDELPMRVAAIGNDFLQPGIVDVSTIHMEFEGGKTAEISSRWFNPEKVQKLVVIGESAMAIFDDRQQWDKKLHWSNYAVDRSGPRPVASLSSAEYLPVQQGEPLKTEMQHFLDCVATGSVPRTDSSEAIRVLTVLAAAQSSIDSKGKWVNVER